MRSRIAGLPGTPPLGPRWQVRPSLAARETEVRTDLWKAAQLFVVRLFKAELALRQELETRWMRGGVY